MTLEEQKAREFASGQAVEAQNLTDEWIGKTVNAIGVFLRFPEQGAYVVIRHELRAIAYHPEGIVLRFASGADLLVKPDATVRISHEGNVH